MGLPGWYVDDPVDVATFDRPPFWSSGERSAPDDSTLKRSSIIHTTYGGIRWVWPKYERREHMYKFRFPRSELASFQALDVAVHGHETPFYYVPDTDDMDTTILCRKEDDFSPRPIGPFDDSGTLDTWYELEFKISEEVAAAEVL